MAESRVSDIKIRRAISSSSSYLDVIKIRMALIILAHRFLRSAARISSSAMMKPSVVSLARPRCEDQRGGRGFLSIFGLLLLLLFVTQIWTNMKKQWETDRISSLSDGVGRNPNFFHREKRREACSGQLNCLRVKQALLWLTSKWRRETHRHRQKRTRTTTRRKWRNHRDDPKKKKKKKEKMFPIDCYSYH